MIYKKKDIFITVNICCYNSSKFLEETIKSVLAQTYLNFELLIIDDGSTDDTKLIVQKFIKKNQNIRYYYQQNNGYPSARNMAINLAKGQWIAIIDHDDIMLPNRLTEQVADILKNPFAKLFSANSNHIDTYGNFTNDNFSKFNPLNLDLSHRIAAFELIKNGCFIGTETVVFEKLSAVNIGGFNEVYKFLGDYDFFIRLALVNKIFVSNKILSNHRVHKDNAQFYYFSTGKGYWEYARIYFKFLFNKKFFITEKIIILKRIYIYIQYGIVRSILNLKYIKYIYMKFKTIK